MATNGLRKTMASARTWVALGVMLVAISAPAPAADPSPATNEADQPYLVILGVAQDGGYPQMACAQSCCVPAWENPDVARYVTSLAIVDPRTGRRWLIDATPDLPDQLHLLDQLSPTGLRSARRDPRLSGIFLTHAHIGHYTGLVHLGREVMGASSIPVFAMPRMESFLRDNGPFSQLVGLENVELRSLAAGESVELGPDLSIEPFLVPHRDEFSETVGFVIDGPFARVLFIPDIDKWTRWDQDLPELLLTVDEALLDGTFFAEGEIPGRAMSEVPHPFIVESLELVESLGEAERAKLRFIHLNHTNPALDPTSPARALIGAAGCAVAEQGQRIEL